MPDLVFPDGFLWGVATSSYQIEGGNTSADWCAWEHSGGAAEKAGAAADSWNRFREDVDLTADLGLNTYRISLEWSRIEPERGVFDGEAIDHYAEWLAYAKQRGLIVMVVLWHFTNPAWLPASEWEGADAAAAFEAYVRRVVPSIAVHVDWWATVNEANTYANQGWLTGEWPPGRHQDYPGGFRVYAGLSDAHVRARQAIKGLVGPHAPVGLTHVIPWAHPASDAFFPGPCIAWWNWLGYTNFLDRVAGHLDWLGVQYYYDGPCKTLSHALDDGDPPRSDMGWRIAPEGLYRVVKHAANRYRVPIIVTENGLADAEDRQRSRFILDHLAWLHRAIAEGVDVRGYLHWSLIDNFEWAEGFGPRFGLVEVDYSTHERTPRPSAHLYSRIAQENRMTQDMGRGMSYSDGTPTLGPRSE